MLLIQIKDSLNHRQSVLKTDCQLWPVTTPTVQNTHLYVMKSNANVEKSIKNVYLQTSIKSLRLFMTKDLNLKILLTKFLQF